MTCPCGILSCSREHLASHKPMLLHSWKEEPWHEAATPSQEQWSFVLVHDTLACLDPRRQVSVSQTELCFLSLALQTALPPIKSYIQGVSQKTTGVPCPGLSLPYNQELVELFLSLTYIVFQSLLPPYFIAKILAIRAHQNHPRSLLKCRFLSLTFENDEF